MKKLLELSMFVCIIFVSISVSALAIPDIIDVEGTIFELDGITTIWRSVNISIENLNNSVKVEGVTSTINPSRFKISISGNNQDTGLLTVWNRDHQNNKTFLLGVVRNESILLNMTIPNYAPDFITLPNTTALEDSLYTYEFIVEDYNFDDFNLSLEQGPSGMILYELNQTLYWTPNQSDVDIGSYVISIKAEDINQAVTYQNFTLSITNNNDAPSFTSFPNLSAKELEEYTYQPSTYDEDGDSTSFVLVQSPSGMVLNTTTGFINWTPAQGQRGDQYVVISVNDSQVVVYQNFTLIVSSKNNSDPNITSTPSTTATQSQLYSYTIIAEDIDDEPLTYSLASGPSGASIASNILSWTPNQTDVENSPVLFTILVQDNNSGSETQQFSISVSNVNDKPSISSSPEYFATQDELYTYQVVASDIDGDTLSYSLLDYPTTMRINLKSGLIKWIPNSTDINQSHKVTVKVYDGQVYAKQIYYVYVMESTPATSETVTSSGSEEESGESGAVFGFDFENYIYDIIIVFDDLLTETPLVDAITLSRKPNTVSTPPFLVFKYFNISLDLNESVNVVNASIFFKVPDSFLNKTNSSVEDIVLLRYNVTWQILNTSFILRNKTLTYYIATSEGFSVFAIAANNKTVPAETRIYIPTPVLNLSGFINISGVIFRKDNKTQVAMLTPLVILNNRTGENYKSLTGLLDEKNTGSFKTSVRAKINDTLLFFVYDPKHNLTYKQQLIVQDGGSIYYDILTDFPVDRNLKLIFIIPFILLIIVCVYWFLLRNKKQKHPFNKCRHKK